MTTIDPRPGLPAAVRSSAGLTLATRTSGDGDAVLLGLHGGPGGGDYLDLLHAMAGPARRVVTFDQLGCGRSVPVPDDHVWSMAEAVADVDAVRAAAGAETLDLVGHSWGGMLALEYTLTHPERVSRLVLWSTVASVAGLTAGFLRQLAALLDDDELTGAVTADAFGSHDEPAFRTALLRWLDVYMTPDTSERDGLLDEILRPDAASLGLWGSRLWLCDGALRGWSAESRLHRITAPTLVVHGGHDASDHEVNRVLADGIPGSEWLTLASESHMLGERAGVLLLRLIDGFLGAPALPRMTAPATTATDTKDSP